MKILETLQDKIFNALVEEDFIFLFFVFLLLPLFGLIVLLYHLYKFITAQAVLINK